jgi:hypothetical protein
MPKATYEIGRTIVVLPHILSISRLFKDFDPCVTIDFRSKLPEGQDFLFGFKVYVAGSKYPFSFYDPDLQIAKKTRADLIGSIGEFYRAGQVRNSLSPLS